MATGSEYIHWYVKKLLGLTEIDKLHGYLRDLTVWLQQATYSKAGILADAQVDLDLTTPDKVGFNPTSFRAVDSQAGGAQYSPGTASMGGTGPWSFENANGVPYYVAVPVAYDVPATVQTNPRTGAIEYGSFYEWAGLVASPNSVTVQGGGLRVRVDSVTEVGVSNAGRKVRVWKIAPASALGAGVTWEDLTVQWDAGLGQNYVVTAGHFGQSSPSTAPGHYYVALQGPWILRNTVLSSSSSIPFVGIVGGGGAGNVPAYRDVSGQRLLGANLSHLWDVLELVSGVAKVRVRAANAEAGSASQISVKDLQSGNTTFKVDKAGNVTASGAILGGTLGITGATEFNADVTLRSNPTASTSPKVKYTDTTGTSYARGNQGVHEVYGPDGVDLQPGALEHVFGPGMYRYDGNPLHLGDANTAAGGGAPGSGSLAFSSGSDRRIDATLRQNLLGAINEAARNAVGLGHLLRNGILDGGVASIVDPGGAATVSITASTVLKSGFFIAQASASGLVLTAPATQGKVYLDTADMTIKVQTGTGAWPAGSIPLAKGAGDGAGHWIGITDARDLLRKLDARTEILVGDASCTDVHFSNLAAAFDAIKDAHPLLTEHIWRIVVVGQCVEPAVTLTVPDTDMQIVGQGGTVEWGTDDALFDINGKARCTFENLRIKWTGNTAAPNDGDRVVWRSASAVDRLVLRDCEVWSSDPTYALSGVAKIAGALTDSIMDNLRCVDCGDFGLYLTDATHVRVARCHFVGTTSSAGGTGGLGGVVVGQGSDVTISECHVKGAKLNTGIYLGAGGTTTDCVVVGCKVDTINLDGILLSSNASRCRVIGCTVRGAARTPSASYGGGLTTFGTRLYIQGNDLHTNHVSGNPSVALWIGTGTSKCIFDGNQLNGQGKQDDTTATYGTLVNERDDA
jgi:hypothetical protein